MSGGLNFLDTLTHIPLVETKVDMALELQVVDVNDLGQQQGQQQGLAPNIGDEKNEENEDMSICTITNPLSRLFIDLRPLSAFGNEGKPVPLGVRGYDSGVNFTLGICSTPMKKVHDRIDIKDELDPMKIGAYYKDVVTNQYVSIGEFNTQPVFRGKKLTLTYGNGSYCNLVDEKTGEKVRKSTIITLVCDRETQKKASVSYIGNIHDCDYMFEVRSHHVCPTANKDNNLNAFWIFLIIVVAAGGLLYRNMKLRTTH